MRSLRSFRIAACIAGLTWIAATAVGCGAEHDASRDSGSNWDSPITLRLLPWYEDWHWIDGLLDEFRAQHPDIRLEKLHATQEEMTLRTLIASGDPPDVFCISYETLPGLLRAGAVAPLGSRPWSQRRPSC